MLSVYSVEIVKQDGGLFSTLFKKAEDLGPVRRGGEAGEAGETTRVTVFYATASSVQLVEEPQLRSLRG
jgi:hypothetical protein